MMPAPPAPSGPRSVPPPAAAVIVPHYNDHARLERCLAALSGNDLADIEVIVVDNGSDPAPRLDEALEARLVHETARGAAAARNRGVAETRAPVLMFLDADCVPAADWVTTGLRLTRPDTIVGGRVDVFAESDGPLSGAEAFETVFAFQQRDYVETKRFSVTANLVTTRELFERTGPFVVGLSEDMDWCHRALAAGGRLIYADELAVAHPARQDWPALEKKWRRLTEESFALTGSDRRTRLLWGARALAMIPSVALHARRILTSPDLTTGRERRDAIATLARLRLRRMGWMLRQSLTGRLN